MKEITLNQEEEFKFNFLNETKDLLIDANRIFLSIKQNPNISELELILTLTKYIKSTSMVVQCKQILKVSLDVEKIIYEILQDQKLLTAEAIEIIQNMYQRISIIIDKKLNNKFNRFIDEFQEMVDTND